MEMEKVGDIVESNLYLEIRTVDDEKCLITSQIDDPFFDPNEHEIAVIMDSLQHAASFPLALMPEPPLWLLGPAHQIVQGIAIRQGGEYFTVAKSCRPKYLMGRHIVPPIRNISATPATRTGRIPRRLGQQAKQAYGERFAAN